MFGLDFYANQILLNRSHPLNVGRVSWWLALPQKPGCFGGTTWIDLVGGIPGTLTGFASGFGWTPQTYQGGVGGLITNSSGAGTVSVSPRQNLGTTHSLGIWFNVYVGQNTQQVLVYDSVTSTDPFVVRLSSGGVLLRYAAGSATASVSSSAINGGTWYFAGVSRSGTSVTFYLNGNAYGATQTLSANNTTFFDHFMGFGGAILFHGLINDFSVYNRVLSATEWSALYQLGQRGYFGVLRRQRRLALNAATAAVLPWGWQEAETTPWRRQLREPIQMIPR